MIFFPKMRIYTVHINPEIAHAVEKPILVSDGFSWKALVFGVLWTLYHRLWTVSIVLAAVAVLFILASEHKWLDATSLFILQAAFNFYIGFSASDWYRDSLAARGYITYDIVVSDSDMRAQQRYFERVGA
jgi:hypothetical protein